MWDAYVGVLKKYTAFEGRAGRREFWSFALVNFIVSVLLNWILPALGAIYSLAVLLPSLAVGVRRLHDINRTGWWLLIGFIPVIGFIVLLVFAIQKGDAGSNRYGASSGGSAPTPEAPAAPAA